MKVLIAGASSALGSRVAARLRERGDDVSGITRGDGAALRRGGVTPVTADLLDAGAVVDAVEAVRPDALVWTVNALPKAGPRKPGDVVATNRVRSIGGPNLMRAARAARVQRIVAESLGLAYGSRPLGSPPVTEESPLASGQPPHLQQMIDAVATLEAETTGARGVALRMGGFYGPGVGSTEDWIARLRKRRLPVFDGLRGAFSIVHIDDAADAVVAALDRAPSVTGEVFNVADDEPPTLARILTTIASQIGAPAPRVMPQWLLRFAGSFMAAVLRGNLEMSNHKAKQMLGWRPRYPTIADGARTLSAGAQRRTA